MRSSCLGAAFTSLMGSRNPERDAPFLVGPEPLTACNDNWSIFATCTRCGHERRLGRLKNIAGVKRLKTAAELREKLTCRECGAKQPSLKAFYIGKRRD